MRTCPSCAQPAQNDTVIFCAYCGRRLPTAPHTPPPIPQSRRPVTAQPKRSGWTFAFICMGLFALLFIRALVNSPSEEQPRDISKQAMQKALSEKLKAEIDKNYSDGVSSLKQGRFAEALSSFGLVEQVNPTYKDLPLQMSRAREGKAAERVRAAQRQAELALKSGSCWSLANAKTDLNEVPEPGSSEQIRQLIKKVTERQLSCFEGNSQLRMAIQIQRRDPVSLYVWIKNESGVVRHANPNYFTLITQDGESYPYSSKTFEYSKSFPAVNLQPGTEASGMVVFDTGKLPKTLVYRELLGTQISRDFR